MGYGQRPASPNFQAGFGYHRAKVASLAESIHGHLAAGFGAGASVTATDEGSAGTVLNIYPMALRIVEGHHALEMNGITAFRLTGRELAHLPRCCQRGKRHRPRNDGVR